MTTPAPSYDFDQVKYTFFKSATRLANLWYTLTIIMVILWILSALLTCLGLILGAGSLMSLINSLSSYGY